MATTNTTPPVVHISSDAELRQVLAANFTAYDIAPPGAALVTI